MKKIRVRRWAQSALAVAVLLAAVSPIRAVFLAPGNCAALFGTTAAIRPELAGVALQDNLIPFTIVDGVGNPCYAGMVQDTVLQSTLTGALHFYFRIRDTDPNLPCCIATVARTGFGFGTDVGVGLTDVDYRLDGLGTVGPVQACRTATGDEVDFYFDPCIQAGSDSKYVFVITGAMNFGQVGTLTLTTIDGYSVTLPVAAPM